MHLATNRDDVAATDDIDLYLAQRPDGTPRPLTGPKITPGRTGADDKASQVRVAAAQESA